jgi:hypothetical protein
MSQTSKIDLSLKLKQNIFYWNGRMFSFSDIKCLEASESSVRPSKYQDQLKYILKAVKCKQNTINHYQEPRVPALLLQVLKWLMIFMEYLLITF